MDGNLRVEEYKSLRKELQQLAAGISRWQMVGFVSAGVFLVVSGALFNYGLFWACGVPYSALLVIAGCIFGIIHDLQSILRIAAYIQAFHEGEQTGALWETRLEKARGANIFTPLRNWMTPIPSLWWAGLVCALLPIVYIIWSCHFFSRNFLIWFGGDLYIFYYVIIIPVVWVIFWLAISKSHSALGRFKEDTLAAFKQIAADEHRKADEE